MGSWASWATGDENENWKIILKTEGYERAQLSDVGQQVCWIIDNAQVPPSVREIVEHLMIDGDPLAPRSVEDQRDRVHNILHNMRRRGLVQSVRQDGLLRWMMPGASPPATSSPANLGGPAPISDSEWAVLRWHLPLPARRRSSEVNTRAFLLAVMREARSEGPLRLTPGQSKRFMAWRQLSVWQQVTGALPDRISASDIAAVEERIVAGGALTY